MCRRDYHSIMTARRLTIWTHSAEKAVCNEFAEKGADEKDKTWDGCFALHLRDGTGETCQSMSDTFVRNTFAVLEPSSVNGKGRYI